MSYDTPCVNTILLDRHIDLQDQWDKSFEYAYENVRSICTSDLEDATCREDIEDDILYEAKVFIEQNSVFDADANEVTERLLQDYDL